MGTRLAACAVIALLLAGCQPSGPEALLRGDQELQAGHPAEAVRLLELAATKLPSDARAWNHLGLAYHAAGRLGDAQKAYLRALNFDRNLAEVQYNLGQLHLDLGNGRDAETAFRAFLAASPENARNAGVWSGLGQALYLQRQYAQSETAFGNVLHIDPNDADVWNRLGLARVQLRHFREAYLSFGQAVRLDPKLAQAHLNLGVTAQQYLGDRRAALQHYRDYLALNPADADGVRRNVHDLELKLGLVRPDAPPAPTNTPPIVAARGTNDDAAARFAATNRPPPPVVVLVRTNTPPRPDPTRTTVPPTVVHNTKPTNTPPAAIRTNPAPAVVALAPTNPVPIPERPTTPIVAVVPKPAPEKPPLEVVRVDDEPPPVVARDLPKTTVPALPVAQPPETVIPTPAVVVTTPPAATTPAETPADAVPEARPDAIDAGQPSGKRGFWQKVNPVSWGNPAKWFKKDATKATAIASKPESSGIAEAVATRPAARVTPLEVPPVAKPVFERYEPARPRLVPTGNHAQADVEYQRGVAAHQRHDTATALAEYRRAVQIDPSHFEAQHNLMVAALESNDTPTALLAGESAVTLVPASSNARYNFAVALQRARHPEDAVDQLSAITRMHPDDANAHLALASLCAGDLEDATRARREYESVLALSPNHPQAENIRRWLERNPAR